MDTYKTIIKETTTQFVEKHSKFIGYVAHTETDEEAVDFIEKIRTLHSDAKHNVYAYVLNEDNRSRYSDDGEPHGTAGKPILDIINGFKLKDVTVVVTRYFGGILLGTGGLVRAYSKAAKDTLDFAEKVFMVPGETYKIECAYNFYASLESLIKDFDGLIENTLFEDNVILEFTLSNENVPSFLDALTQTFANKLSAIKIGEKFSIQKIF